MEEIWKDIAGYEGYQVSNLGRVRTNLPFGVATDRTDYRLVKQHTRNLYPFVVIRKKSERKAHTLYVHRLVVSCFVKILSSKNHVDHIDHNPSNNALSNLRVCSRSENLFNRKVSDKSKRKNKSTVQSKYKGVWYEHRRHRWIAEIQANGIKTYLGSFREELDAARCYDQASLRIHKEFSLINGV